MTWENAACRELAQYDHETFDNYFFPDSWRERAATKMAKKICAVCPVRLECLQTALDNHEPDGLWGGLTPDERQKSQRHLTIVE